MIIEVPAGDGSFDGPLGSSPDPYHNLQVVGSALNMRWQRSGSLFQKPKQKATASFEQQHVSLWG